MDWLALRIAGDQDFWPSGGNDVESDFPDGSDKRLTWEVFTSDKNIACAGQLDLENLEEDVNGQRSSPELNKAQRALGIRKRLGELTHWTGPTSMLAVAIAHSVEAVMNSRDLGVDIEPKKDKKFTWHLKIKVGLEDPLEVQLSVENRGGGWTMNSSQVDAALSLWLFHIRNGAGNDSRGGPAGDWLRKDKGLMRKICRVMGSRASHAGERDIRWWIGHFEDFTSPHTKVDETHRQTTYPFGPIGFVGIATKTDDEGTWNPAGGRSDEENHGNLAQY